jgi:RimJ/RimL family protein N-acetyltransferase
MRLIYRSIDASTPSITFFYDLFSNPQTLACIEPSLLKPLTRQECRQWIELVRDSFLAVFLCVPVANISEPTELATKPVGFVLLGTATDGEAQHRRSVLRIAVEPEEQGKGYGREAVRWALDWAFNTAGLHRVEVSVPGYNEKVIGLFERLRFVKEGIKRQHLWFDGRWWDEMIFGVLEKEWRLGFRGPEERGEPEGETGAEDETRECLGINQDSSRPDAVKTLAVEHGDLTPIATEQEAHNAARTGAGNDDDFNVTTTSAIRGLVVGVGEDRDIVKESKDSDWMLIEGDVNPRVGRSAQEGQQQSTASIIKQAGSASVRIVKRVSFTI